MQTIIQCFSAKQNPLIIGAQSAFGGGRSTMRPEPHSSGSKWGRTALPSLCLSLLRKVFLGASTCERLCYAEPATTIFSLRKISVAEPRTDSEPKQKPILRWALVLVAGAGLEPATLWL